MADNISDVVLKYSVDLTDVQSKLALIERANASLAANLGNQFGQSVDVLSSKLTSLDPGKGLATFSTVLKQSNGDLVTFTEKVKSTATGAEQVSGVFKNGGASAKTFGDEVRSLAERAAFTIPIWIALRSVVTALLDVFKNGFNDLKNFDEALQNLRRNLTGSPAEIEQSFTTLRREITAASLETGVSADKIALTIKQFAALGFNLSDSLSAGLGITKLSILLFGDASQAAGNYATALKELVDTSVGAKSSQEQIAEAFSLTNELEKSNRLNLNDFSASFSRFAGTAKTAGLSIQETLALLAALSSVGRSGSQAGTLLTASIDQLLNHSTKLADALGVQVNPAIDDTFTTLLKVTDAANKLSKSGLVESRADIIQALSAIFGGARGTQVISALAAVNDLLQKNAQIIPSANKFNDDFIQRQQSIAQQLNLSGNAVREFGKSLVETLLGGEDIVTNLTNITKSLQGLATNANITATFIKALFNPINLLALSVAILPQALAAGTSGLILFGKALQGVVSIATLGAGLPGFLLFLTSAFAAFTTTIPASIKAADDKAQTDFKHLLDGLKGQLDKASLEQLVISIQQGNIKVDPAVKDRVLKALQDQLSGFDEAGKKIELHVAGTISSEDVSKLNKTVTDIIAAQLKDEGASQAQVLQTIDAVKKRLNIEQDTLSLTTRQLELQKALTEERKLQNRIGSDSLKLFEIAQTEGVNIAKKIGDALQGNIDFTSFVRQGGRALEVFQTEFADKFKNQQAQAFFQGNITPGLNSLQGGFGVPISESAIRNTFNPSDALLASNQAQTLFKALDNFKAAKVELHADAVTFSAGGALNGRDVFNNSTLDVQSSPVTQISQDTLRFIQEARANFSDQKNLQVAVTIDLAGNQNVIVGTPEEITRKISGAVGETVRSAIVKNISEFPESPEAKAVVKRQNEN